MALFCVISANSGSFRAHCVKVHVRYLIPDEFLLKLGAASLRPPKGTSLRRHTSYDVYIVNRSIRFAQITLLANSPRSYALQCFSIGRMPQKSVLSVGESALQYNNGPWTHPTQHPKLHFDRFSRFCTAHGRESLYFTMGRPFSHQN